MRVAAGSPRPPLLAALAAHAVRGADDAATALDVDADHGGPHGGIGTGHGRGVDARSFSRSILSDSYGSAAISI